MSEKKRISLVRQDDKTRVINWLSSVIGVYPPYEIYFEENQGVFKGLVIGNGTVKIDEEILHIDSYSVELFPLRVMADNGKGKIRLWDPRITELSISVRTTEQEKLGEEEFVDFLKAWVERLNVLIIKKLVSYDIPCSLCNGSGCESCHGSGSVRRTAVSKWM